ncbi:MAG: GNAT family N-acetyltransferase [Burkholderiales bacterium]|nr:GNAT family N-acetyltransferase [Phycisphaerae bacterium]
MPQDGPLPMLKTERLLLRPFALADAPRVQLLAGDPRIADTTMAIPHPYLDGMAEEWISQHDALWRDRDHAVWAICTRDATLVGAINIAANLRDGRAWLGYWIGHAYWNNGYCSEAGRAVMEFGYGYLGLHRIFAEHLLRNPASGRVMKNLGMRQEGILRGHVKKNGVHEDLVSWGRLRTD